MLRLSIFVAIQFLMNLGLVTFAYGGNFSLIQKGFPDSGEINGFFSGNDENNDGFLTKTIDAENELIAWSFEYFMGKNVPSFVIEGDIADAPFLNLLEFSYDINNNELLFANVQDGSEFGEIGFLYNKDGFPRFERAIAFVFLDSPADDKRDDSFELATVSNKTVSEFTSILALFFLGAFGLRLTFKNKLKALLRD